MTSDESKENGKSGTLSADLAKRVVEQLEYYFGNINLPRDKFLQKEIKNDEGWVPITTLLTFNRLAALSKDGPAIAQAVKEGNSEILQVSEDGQKLRRNPLNPLPENTLEYWQTIKHRTAYMKGFPTESTLDEIEVYVRQFGHVENVLMRRIKGDRTFKGSIFATYKTREEAEKAVQATDPFKEITLTKMLQDDYWTAKNAEAKAKKAAEKAAKQQKNIQENVKSKKAHDAAHFVKGLVLAVDGLPTSATIASLKDFFKPFGEVQYVQHEEGSSKAEFRFKGSDGDEGVAAAAWKKAQEAGKDGKVIFGEAELTGRVLEGEEEEKYWTTFSEQKVFIPTHADYPFQARKQEQKNQRRGGGRGGRGRSRGGRGGGRGGRGREEKEEDGGDETGGRKRAAHADAEAPPNKRIVFEDDDD